MAPPDEVPPPLPPEEADEAAQARRLGLSIPTYRARRMLEAAAAQDHRPADIAQEEDRAAALRREPGLFKPRHEAPNVFVQAAETPGELAKLVIFVAVYLAAMIALIVAGGERVQKMPGVLQCLVLGLLLLPVGWVTGRVWEGIGERGRDVARFLVRAWPLTLILLLLVLGGLRLLLGGKT